MTWRWFEVRLHGLSPSSLWVFLVNRAREESKEQARVIDDHDGSVLMQEMGLTVIDGGKA